MAPALHGFQPIVQPTHAVDNGPEVTIVEVMTSDRGANPFFRLPCSMVRAQPSNSGTRRKVPSGARRAGQEGGKVGEGCLEYRPGGSATRGQIAKIVYVAIR